MGTADRVGHAIREALSRDVKVQMFMRDDEQTNPKEHWLAETAPLAARGLRVFGVPALHAKLYFSESNALVTSLNLLASSFLNTIEAGLWSTDVRAVRTVEDFLSKYVQPSARPIRFDSEETGSVRERSARPLSAEGYCIRCGATVALDVRRPYCRGDFAKWSEWGNEDFVDRFCHGCGKDYPTTMRRPLCEGCFRRTN